tara:strand:- start:593 stop:1549 length:957 start_codon:yes stop_codon:yes gene_type:complete
MSVLNKNNYGYISPSDFNLFAKQAQLDLFETYFYQYNYQINKENARTSGTGYANITKTIEELIEVFSMTNPLSLSTAPPTLSNIYYLPSVTTTGDDYYLMNKVLIYNELIYKGTTTTESVSGLECIDALATFITDGVLPGYTIALVAGGITQYVTVVSVNSETSITTTASVVNSQPWLTKPLDYCIYSNVINEAEKVSHSKITMLNNSVITKPTLTYPAYTQEYDLLTAFPPVINNIGQVLTQYIRYPKDPKWTFVSLTNGEPAFDQSQPDYQDLELPLDCEPDLINKILQYSGMSIREVAAVQFAQSLDQADNQSQQ